MCSRGVWQLRSLLVEFCQSSGSSAGVRDYAQRFLVPFAEANPQIQIALSRRANRHPRVTGWYSNDRPKTLSLINLSAEQVVERIQFLRDARPVGLKKNSKAFRTTPSIQGEWEMGQKLEQPHRTIRC
jgi:large subunit ribosomal protein L43